MVGMLKSMHKAHQNINKKYFYLSIQFPILSHSLHSWANSQRLLFGEVKRREICMNNPMWRVLGKLSIASLHHFFGTVLIVMAVTACSDGSNNVNDNSRTAEDFLYVDTMVGPDLTDASIHVRMYGKRADRGEFVVLLPSLGRGVEDFTEEYGSNLTTRLAEKGYRVVLPQPRGYGDSTGDLTPGNAAMITLVEDVRQSLDALEIQRAHFIGHAYGNRVARSFAVMYPSYVADVTLVAAGGQVPLRDDQRNTLLSIFFTEDDDERLKFIEDGFFSPGNDPSVWLYGWDRDVALMQQGANSNNDIDFVEAGGKPILLLQAADDFIAPPEDAGRLLADLLGEQVTYVELENAGHALLPERPDAIADEIIAYYADRPINDE
jgi:pimeloyl-ACP methyl ester carboxylesterase